MSVIDRVNAQLSEDDSTVKVRLVHRKFGWSDIVCKVLTDMVFVWAGLRLVEFALGAYGVSIKFVPTYLGILGLSMILSSIRRPS